MIKNRRNIIASLVVMLAVCVSAPSLVAQKTKGIANGEEKRREWITEMRNFKHEFFKKELGLTREQETPFFKAYDQMDDELIRVGEETRALERKINADSDASETEMESAARTLFEQKKKEGEIELKYFEEYKNILTKRQLLKLKETERRFNRALLSRSKERPHSEKEKQ